MEQDSARELTGRADSARILDNLVQECFFITRYEQPSGNRYRYHPLFQGFLRDCSRHRTDKKKLRKLQLRIIELLMDMGNFHDSIPLCLELKDWNLALKALNHIAQDYVDWGRQQTLLRWLDRFPGPRRTRNLSPMPPRYKRCDIV